MILPSYETHHRQAAALADQGLPLIDIAHAVGVCTHTIYTWRNKGIIARPKRPPKALLPPPGLGRYYCPDCAYCSDTAPELATHKAERHRS